MTATFKGSFYSISIKESTVYRRLRMNVPSYPTNASGVNVSRQRPTNISPDTM
jgi:hypothetical protein